MRYVSAGALSGVGAASRSLLAPQTRPPGTYITFFYTGAGVALVVEIMPMVVSACLSGSPPLPFPRFSQKHSIHGLAVVVGRQLSLIWFIRFAQVMIGTCVPPLDQGHRDNARITTIGPLALLRLSLSASAPS